MNSTVFLRRITIFTFLPALILFIVHGVRSKYAFPALGLVPLAASAFLGLLLLHRDSVAGLGSPIQLLSASNVFFADTILAGSFLACLILTWIFLAEPWSTGVVILGTYCSVFLMVSFGIHFYFAVGEALHIVTSRTSPFRSLAADYPPLTRDDYAPLTSDNYTDETQNFNQGTMMA
ncbi:unnamed protein product [Discula destructiva]